MSRSLLDETGTVIAIEDGTDLYLEQDTYTAEVLADSPVSYWLLTETSGTNAVDQQAANAGTYTGGYTQNQTGPTPGDTTNKAVLLDGTSGYVSAADNNSFDLGDVFTLELWAKLSGGGGTERALISKGPNAYLIWIYSNNKFRLTRQDIAHICESTSTITDTTAFHHLVATKNGATSKVYIDGVDVTDPVALGTSTMTNTTDALNIGRRVNSNNLWFPGTIAKPAVYATALSASRILAHYNAGITA